MTPGRAVLRPGWLLAAIALSGCLDPGGSGPSASGPGLEPPVGDGRGAGDGVGDPGSTSGPGDATGGPGATPSVPSDSEAVDGGLPVDGGPDAGGVEIPRVPVPPPEPVGCVTDVSAGAHAAIPCEGITHDLHVPEECLEWACGLVLDVHGGTMSSRMEDKNTNLQALGAEHGYVVLQPSAFGGLWSALVDDDKVFHFANDVIAAFHLDEKRVHMTGFSQGGYMTWRFVCRRTDWLASAAPAAASGMAVINIETGCSFTGTPGTDAPTGEIPLLYMHGTMDALVLFPNATTQRDAVRALYEATEEEIVSMDADHVRTRYTNARGVPFEFLEHDYASASAVGLPPLGVAIVGHCYPGSEDFMPTEPGQLMGFGCEPPTAFHWGEEIMRFFIDHPRR